MACVRLTARAAQMLFDLLVKLETERGLDLRSFFSRPRGKVALGSCPFWRATGDRRAILAPRVNGRVPASRARRRAGATPATSGYFQIFRMVWFQ